jgi:hypothetical protein
MLIGGPSTQGVLRNSDGTVKQYVSGKGPDTTKGNPGEPDTVTTVNYVEPKRLK